MLDSDKYYSTQDFAIMFIRGMLLPSVVVYYAGFMYGVVGYFAFFQLYYAVMRHVYKHDALSALDEFFLLDNPKNRANIITVVKVDKMKDYQSLRQKIIDLALKHPRLSHQLKKVLGEYYFVPVEPHRLQEVIK